MDETLEVEELRFGRKGRSRDLGGIGRRIVPDQHDVIRREIPVGAGKQPAEAAIEEEIVGVEDADERRSGGLDRGVTGKGRTAVDVETHDRKPAAAVIGGARHIQRIVGGGVVDHDDFRHLRLA